MEAVQELFEQALTDVMTSSDGIKKVVGTVLHATEHVTSDNDTPYDEKTMMYRFVDENDQELSQLVCSFYTHHCNDPFFSVRAGFKIATPMQEQAVNAYYHAVQQMNRHINSGSCQLISREDGRWGFACDLSIISGMPDSVNQRSMSNFVEIIPKALMFFSAMEAVNSFLAFTETMVDEEGNFDARQAADVLSEMAEEHTIH